MSKRINVVLPDETVAVLNRAAPSGSRSRLVSEAVVYYVRTRGKRALSTRLKQGALSNARRDLEIAQEWFSLDEKSCQDR
jgi:CopG family transcriptional regulator/antitoxin EndoAI